MKLIKNQEYDSSITFWDTLFTEEKLRIIASQILGVDVDDISTQEDSPSQFNQFKFEIIDTFYQKYKHQKLRYIDENKILVSDGTLLVLDVVNGLKTLNQN
jgi:hypothetical protein